MDTDEMGLASTLLSGEWAILRKSLTGAVAAVGIAATVLAAAPGSLEDDFAADRGDASNAWHQNREAMANGHFSGFLKNFVYEDFIIEESMGPIMDRTKEFLGTSDAVNRVRLVLDGNHLIGALVMGDQTLSRPLQELIVEAADLAPLRDALLAGGATVLEQLAVFHQTWRQTRPPSTHA